jgi:hypothetical protein
VRKPLLGILLDMKNEGVMPENLNIRWTESILETANVTDETLENEGDLVDTYAASLDSVLSEGELIWSRYNAFMVAVSVFFAFGGVTDYPFANIAINVSGGFICICWLFIHVSGYKVFSRRVERARRYSWHKAKHEYPLSALPPTDDWIEGISIAAIIVFLIAYGILSYYHIIQAITVVDHSTLYKLFAAIYH